MSDKYILRGHDIVNVDLDTWAKWFEENHNNRHVANQEVNGARVSTVFLGIDHSFGYGPPQIFETMVFGGPLDQEQDRCFTWEQAEAMHQRMVERVVAGK